MPKLIVLNQVCDPYEPPKCCGIFSSMEKLLEEVKKNKVTAEWKIFKEIDTFDEGSITWRNIEAAPNDADLVINRYSFGPEYYIDEMEVDTLYVDEKE